MQNDRRPNPISLQLNLSACQHAEYWLDWAAIFETYIVLEKEIDLGRKQITFVQLILMEELLFFVH